MDGRFLRAPQKEFRDSFEYKLSCELGVSWMGSCREGRFVLAILFWTASNLIRSMDIYLGGYCLWELLYIR